MPPLPEPGSRTDVTVADGHQQHLGPQGRQSEKPEPGGQRVSSPGEVMRLAASAREILTELRGEGLGDAARRRVNVIYDRSIAQLSPLLSEGLRAELRSLLGAQHEEQFETNPSTGELRVAEAQLAGWLDGLLQTMQASIAGEAVRAQQALEAQHREDCDRRQTGGGPMDTSYL